MKSLKPSLLEQKHNIGLSITHPITCMQVKVKDAEGQQAGEVTATLRLFPSRSPGKVRDKESGLESIDLFLVTAGPRGAPKELNTRSPHHSKEFS
jgi:hypothetical protein